MPGLADMHVHLAKPSDPPGTAEAELVLFIANGIATIRRMRGFPGHLAMRDKVADGELLRQRSSPPDGGSTAIRLSHPEGEASVRLA